MGYTADVITEIEVNRLKENGKKRYPIEDICYADKFNITWKPN
jgi:hypothetical protein